MFVLVMVGNVNNVKLVKEEVLYNNRVILMVKYFYKHTTVPLVKHKVQF